MRRHFLLPVPTSVITRLFHLSNVKIERSPDYVNQYYVYIMSNLSMTLYVGITRNLERRVYEHKQKLVDSFTKRYNITMLVYYEATSDVSSAIAREKEVKGWLRAKKIALIHSMNPELRDLSAGWYEGNPRAAKP